MQKMEKIKTYTLREFLTLDTNTIQKYIPVLSLVNPLQHFKSGKIRKIKHGINSITELSWGEVSTLKKLIQTATIEDIAQAVQIVYKVKDATKLDIFTFYGCANFIAKEIQKINEVEAERFSSLPTKHDLLFKEAGGDQLSKFSEIATLDNLAGGNVLLFDQIEKQPYLLIHYLLWYRHEKDNVNSQFQEMIQNRK